MLVSRLRDTLGEATLFPPDPSDKQAVKKKRVIRHVAKGKPVDAPEATTTTTSAAAPAATPAAPAAPAAPAKAAQSGGASDPFSALR